MQNILTLSVPYISK